ncbi:unnamed protein product [Didymodactylos carnosus]|uniref:Uncharacterized protein n=1 Tax=Didymodactylos carnosus TaxID=1234261 RepID=A0A8S2E4B1_9BILA|nr:unnamed protein product [Didymodactylos carnosus]CAF3846014.1 unnamed protein product [Didymodactylos carnosus]
MKLLRIPDIYDKIGPDSESAAYDESEWGFDDILVGIDDWDEMQEYDADDDDDVVFVEERLGEWCEFKEDRGDDDVVFVEERCGSGSMWYACDGGEDGLICMEECISMNV